MGGGLDDDYIELLHQLQRMQLPGRGQLQQDEQHRESIAGSDPEEAGVGVGHETAEREIVGPEAEIIEPENPEARLLNALHVELRCARELHIELLDDKNLDRILLGDLDRDVIAQCFRHGVVVNRRHRLVRRLQDSPDTDRVLMTFLASAVYSAMNHFWGDIEDDHERKIHHELVGALLQPSSETAQGSEPHRLPMHDRSHPRS